MDRYKVRYARLVILEREFDCNGGMDEVKRTARELETDGFLNISPIDINPENAKDGIAVVEVQD